AVPARMRHPAGRAADGRRSSPLQRPAVSVGGRQAPRRSARSARASARTAAQLTGLLFPRSCPGTTHENKPCTETVHGKKKKQRERGWKPPLPLRVERAEI